MSGAASYIKNKNMEYPQKEKKNISLLLDK
jgi:hypothetical protein